MTRRSSSKTTANGYNEFRKYWRKAEAGESEFMPIFLPWSIDTAYRARPSVGFEMTADERQLAELHELDAEQVCWRRNKISQLGDENRFCQECPLTPSEAFISSDFGSFIAPELVLKPRKEKIEPHGPLLIGVDPAGNGPDRTSIAYRRGHVIEKIISKRSLDTAIVGNVESRGGGFAPKSKEQPHALGFAPGPTMPSADATREPVPVTGDEQRSMPDARRNVSGCTERGMQERSQARPLYGRGNRTAAGGRGVDPRGNAPHAAC